MADVTPTTVKMIFTRADDTPTTVKMIFTRVDCQCLKNVDHFLIKKRLKNGDKKSI